jgi:hypothetical protein
MNGQVDRGSGDLVVRAVTAIMAAVVGLTFLFGFGNVLSLGLQLGVPVWVAPLVAPAVDLDSWSVAGNSASRPRRCLC